MVFTPVVSSAPLLFGLRSSTPLKRVSRDYVCTRFEGMGPLFQLGSRLASHHVIDMVGLLDSSAHRSL